MSDAHSILTREDGATIGYRRRDGKSPGVVFLCGFNSDMSGTKAEALDAFCAARGHAFLRFDYFAHGVSSGDFADVTIGRLLGDTLAVSGRSSPSANWKNSASAARSRFTIRPTPIRQS